MHGAGTADRLLSDGEVPRVVREALAAWKLADKRVLIIVPDGTSTVPSRKCSACFTRRSPDGLPSGISSSRREPTGPRLASILTVSSA